MHFRDLCRICLSGETSLLYLQDSIIPKFDAIPVGVLDAWTVLTKILITGNNSATNNICTNCNDEIHRFYAFICKSEKSAEFLKSISLGSATPTQRDESGVTAIKTELNESHFDQFVDASHFNSRQTDENFLIEENSIEKCKQESGIFIENVKEEIEMFEIVENVGLNETMEGIAAANKTPSSDLVKSAQCQCPVCEHSCSNEIILEEHIDDVHIADDRCKICSQGIEANYCHYCSHFYNFPVIDHDKIQHFVHHFATDTSRNEIRTNIEEDSSAKEVSQRSELISISRPSDDEGQDCQRNDRKPLYCGYCSKTFRWRIVLVSHICKVHGGLEYKEFSEIECRICLKVFRTKNDLNEHATCHKEEGSREQSIEDPAAPNVEEKFDEELILMSAFEGSEKNNPTGAKTMPSGNVEKSIRKSFQCSKCSKTLSSKEYFVQHVLQAHSVYAQNIERKDFQCTICLKSFKRRSNLNEHMRVHSDELPFRCGMCPRAYQRKISLRNHVAHTHLTVNSDGCIPSVHYLPENILG